MALGVSGQAQAGQLEKPAEAGEIAGFRVRIEAPEHHWRAGRAGGERAADPDGGGKAGFGRRPFCSGKCPVMNWTERSTQAALT